jgi:phage baseplate assembly protein W
MANVKYTVQFPLKFETDDPGYDGIDTDNLPELVNFNLKNVLLTNPGERTWDNDFGVGINQYIFENFEDFEIEALENEIRNQIAEYVPYIYLNNIEFSQSIEGQVLGIQISYTIAQVNTSHILDVVFDQGGGIPSFEGDYSNLP